MTLSRSSSRPAAAPEFADVNCSEQDNIRYLHLGSPWVQGSMNIAKPFDIDLEYVERMMAWLLFVPLIGLGERHAMQLGLGAAALTKFCHKRLHTRTTAIEINPKVVLACRAWFKLPPDDKLLSVVVADAAQEIRRPERLATVDALQVDVYDEEAAAPMLDSAAFYADCRALLTDEGVMTVNLFGRQASYTRSLAQIVEAFGADAVWAFPPTKEGNTVVLAQRQASRPAAEVIVARAAELQTRWKLRTRHWPKLLRPLP